VIEAGGFEIDEHSREISRFFNTFNFLPTLVVILGGSRNNPQLIIK
jgi:hypothetical protein